MVDAAKIKQLNMKLSGMIRRNQSGLDYIEVPDDTWFHDQGSDEVFEFKDGLFCAHNHIQASTNKYRQEYVLKKLPKKAIVATVSVGNGCLKLLSTGGVPAWTRITDTSAIESWLLSRNKKHLQQVHDDKSPQVSSAMKVIMGERGIGPAVEDLLDGKITSIVSDDDERMDQW